MSSLHSTTPNPGSVNSSDGVQIPQADVAKATAPRLFELDPSEYTLPHRQIEGARVGDRMLLALGLNVSPTAKIVAACLAYFAREWTGWPSRETIARLTGVKPPNVTRALRELEQASVIVRRKRYGAGGTVAIQTTFKGMAVAETAVRQAHPEFGQASLEILGRGYQGDTGGSDGGDQNPADPAEIGGRGYQGDTGGSDGGDQNPADPAEIGGRGYQGDTGGSDGGDQNPADPAEIGGRGYQGDTGGSDGGDQNPADPAEIGGRGYQCDTGGSDGGDQNPADPAEIGGRGYQCDTNTGINVIPEPGEEPGSNDMIDNCRSKSDQSLSGSPGYSRARVRELAQPCPICGLSNDSGSERCLGCGHSLEEAEDPGPWPSWYQGLAERVNFERRPKYSDIAEDAAAQGWELLVLAQAAYNYGQHYGHPEILGDPERRISDPRALFRTIAGEVVQEIEAYRARAPALGPRRQRRQGRLGR